MGRRQQEFQTIRSEGGLLPMDLLRRVLNPKDKLEGTRPEDYGLPKGERINETITQSWNRLRRHWVEFREQAARLTEGVTGTGLTNDKWNLPVLRELGFGLLPTSVGPEINGNSYAINRFHGPAAIHLIGCKLSLDKRSAGARGAASHNPHGLVQEFLNRSDEHLWAILSNGLTLRVLRDNEALSRQSYLEFDLETMFDGEIYSDFVLLWLLGHATRFSIKENERPDNCWIEKWTQEAEEQGTRALESLRGGVEKALQTLGQGFVSHPHNTILREHLREGTLELTDLHAQLLRIVYRLIFLFVAEDRLLDGIPVLHPRNKNQEDTKQRDRYSKYYSTGRLRDLASTIRGSRHGDLWHQFNLVVGALSGEEAQDSVRKALNLPTLGSLLWDPMSTIDLNTNELSINRGIELSNSDFLEAIRNLAFIHEGKVLRPVDYKNLGSEELGGVYESLLALTPQVSGDGTQFTFAEFAGSERKLSGSYYTPDSLVQSLLDSALDPVVEKALDGKKGKDTEVAILDLKVCDPAVGSGHFLVGAAHRLARHLSRARAHSAGESEPSPALYQTALRDIIGNCLYGVDINPMSAELCRVSLWLEALEPGKPLSFLDHHIQVGNSLLGATPALMKGGIPDAAFRGIPGDDKKVCALLKKRNWDERHRPQEVLNFKSNTKSISEFEIVHKVISGIDQIPDNTLGNIKQKQSKLEGLINSIDYRHSLIVANAWCAAFVCEKTFDHPDGITENVFRNIERDPEWAGDILKTEISQLAKEYQFFHWHLSFPEVWSKGGFDVIVGNPPWEIIELSEKEYFSTRNEEISMAPTAKIRKNAIENLKITDPNLFHNFKQAKRKTDGIRFLIQNSGSFPLSSYGRINLYPLFFEASTVLINRSGYSGLIVPSAIGMDAYNSKLFSDCLRNEFLVSFFDFENTGHLFPQVHKQYRFCLITIRATAGGNSSISFSFFLHSTNELRDPDRVLNLTLKEIECFSPNTLAPPILIRKIDKTLSTAIYQMFGVFKNKLVQSNNSWDPSIKRMLSLSDPGDLFLKNTKTPTEKMEKYSRLYSGKAIYHYNHRYATYNGNKWQPSTNAERFSPDYKISTEYFVKENEVAKRLQNKSPNTWLFGYRDVTNATNERTVIASIIPRSGCDSHCRNIYFYSSTIDARKISCLLANMNSYMLDYLARQKVIGTGLGAGILEQLPIIEPSHYRDIIMNPDNIDLESWIVNRVIELSYTSYDLNTYAEECGWFGPPFVWNEARRFQILCELDAMFFYIYFKSLDSVERDSISTSKEDIYEIMKYIMGTFPITEKRDKKTFSTYNTFDSIWHVYSLLLVENETSINYVSNISPLPGPSSDPLPEWLPGQQRPENWPLHIHPPKGVENAE